MMNAIAEPAFAIVALAADPVASAERLKQLAEASDDAR